MKNYSANELRDYIEFLEDNKYDIEALVKSCRRTAQHAPQDHRQVMEESARFFTIYADTVIHTEIAAMRLLLPDLEQKEGRNANDNS